MRIEIISGSPREMSVTYRVALHLQKEIEPRTGYEAGIIDVRENLLPQLEQMFTTVDSTPKEYRDLAKRMFAADAFILVSPEYNGSYSACMKNLLDHFPNNTTKYLGL